MERRQILTARGNHFTQGNGWNPTCLWQHNHRSQQAASQKTTASKLATGQIGQPSRLLFFLRSLRFHSLATFLSLFCLSLISATVFGSANFPPPFSTMLEDPIMIWQTLLARTGFFHTQARQNFAQWCMRKHQDKTPRAGTISTQTISKLSHSAQILSANA